MPADRSYWGYDFDDEDWAQARSGGLAGAIRGMQGADNWWDTLTGMAGGFRGGMERSLAGTMEMDQRRAAEEEKRARELEAEMERQRQMEAAQAQVDWARGVLPDDLEAGLIPDAGFASPVEQAKYMGEQTEAYKAAQLKNADAETVRDALIDMGIRPTGDAAIDRKRLEAATKPEAPMTEYQRRSLSLREQSLARSIAEDEEEEQEELDADYRSTDMYRRLRGLPLDPNSPGSLREAAEAKKLSDAAMRRILGDDYTGVASIDEPAVRAIQRERRESGETSAKPPVTSPVVNKPAAPGMPHSHQPKPSEALPTSGPPSKVNVVTNDAALTDKGLQNILQDVGLPPARMQSFMSSGMSVAFKQEWARARTPQERAAIVEKLKLMVAQRQQGMPPA